MYLVISGPLNRNAIWCQSSVWLFTSMRFSSEIPDNLEKTCCKFLFFLGTLIIIWFKFWNIFQVTVEEASVFKFRDKEMSAAHSFVIWAFFFFLSFSLIHKPWLQFVLESWTVQSMRCALITGLLLQRATCGKEKPHWNAEGTWNVKCLLTYCIWHFYCAKNLLLNCLSLFLYKGKAI